MSGEVTFFFVFSVPSLQSSFMCVWGDGSKVKGLLEIGGGKLVTVE